MGNSKLMLGFAENDPSDSTQTNPANKAPFDMRYRYLGTGAFSGFDQAACQTKSVASSCNGWWGSWQEDNVAGGLYAQRHISNSQAASWNGVTRAQIPVFTYYVLLKGSGLTEGVTEVDAINDSTFLTKYFNDWRFLLQKIGSNKAMLHLEPDLWGYMRSKNSDPTAIPAKVTASNSTDCAGYANNAAGFAKCMIGMVRKYAPNATVGLHASPWTYTNSGDAQSLVTFMKALGATDGDFIVTDPSDRDAGYYQVVQNDASHWWDDSKAAVYLAWSKELATGLNKPTVLWQLPLGNSNQDNTSTHYKDNKVEYLFSHLREVADAKVVAMLFGAGEDHQTTLETDGGLLYSKVQQSYAAGGTALCQ